MSFQTFSSINDGEHFNVFIREEAKILLYTDVT